MTGCASRRCHRRSRQRSLAEPLFGLASIAILALLPLVVRDQLGGGPLAYGTLMAGFGTGAVIAGISNGLFRRSLSQERLISLACVACAACSLSLALTSSVAVAAIALALGGGVGLLPGPCLA